ncbi:MAG TPA: hypothetical protein VNV37_00690 [Solirubrobacteraceae bacterium]|nr:hypothetical protein [Solirubrobacteraceae bacterium]
MAGMRDRHLGKRAFIIGNGPSLKGMDLSPLAHEYTFGANRIYLAFDDLGFHTTFLSAIAVEIIEQFGSEMARTPCEVFMSHKYARFENLPSTVTAFLARRGPHFGTHPTRWGFYEGATVTHFSMQLAYYFGFTEVVLVGVDHSFVETGVVAAQTLPQDADDLRPAVVVSHGDDPNHFTPGYFGKGVKWQLPDWQQMELAYTRTRATYERAGRTIVDATVGGKLTIFPKVEYADAISNSRPLHQLVNP